MGLLLSGRAALGATVPQKASRQRQGSRAGLLPHQRQEQPMDYLRVLFLNCLRCHGRLYKYLQEGTLK